MGSTPPFPWKFQSETASVPTQDLDLRFKRMFYSKLSDGFAYAYQSLCDSLANHDLKSLEECMEARLFDEVKRRLEAMQTQDTRLRLVAERNPDVSLYNLGVHLGVHIERKKNFSKSKYILIDTLENMKKRKRNIDNNHRLFKEKLENIWLYVHPLSPASLVISLDVLYHGLNPLTAVRSGTDLFPGQHNEVHHLRFESCVLNLGTQVDAAQSHLLSKLLVPVLQQAEDLVNASWELVDIDHLLSGNPFVV